MVKDALEGLRKFIQTAIFSEICFTRTCIIFYMGIVGHLMLISLDTNSLVKNTGQVTSIAIKFEQGTKRQYKYYPLKIALTNYNEEFRLSDTYKNDFPDLQQKILTGDIVILYTRHKWQSILGWGKQIDIYQIDKDGHTLFNISKVIAEKKSQATIFTVFCIILWPWYFIYRRTRNEMTRQQATLGFMQVGLDIVTSTICKFQLQFQQTNNNQLLYMTSSTYFQSAAVVGGRNAISQPA